MLPASRSILWLFVLLASCPESLGASILVEEPLFLTPYLKRGYISEGRRAALNPNFFGNKESYSGYLTTDETNGTHIFFWYFKAEFAPQDAPVVLWLQGGPGVSSMVGAFLENGPYDFVSNSQLIPRKHYWSQRFHVVYIDNPVGTGYSFTERNDYAVDENQIGETLLEAVAQFFDLFPHLRRNDFFVTGESYAGKYVPALAYHIHISNKSNATNFIPLRGIALGNAIIDPASQLDNGQLFYQLGVFDKNGLNRYESVVDEARKYIKAKYWERATSSYYRLMDLQRDASGLQTLYNLVKDKTDIPLNSLQTLLDSSSAKRALHVGQREFHLQSSQAYLKLTADRTKSVKTWFLEILENYDVLVYNGQLDLLKPYSGLVDFMSELPWSGNEDYKIAPRIICKVDGDVAGYSKTVKHRSKLNQKPIKYVEILVRNAGHLVPRDQPLWAMAMMMNFTGLRLQKSSKG